MSEKAVIIHQSVVKEWSSRKEPPLPSAMIMRALERMNRIQECLPGEHVIVVEESPRTGFTSLPGRVGLGNSARLFGARAAYCLKLAREVLEANGIEVSLDKEGALP